MQRDRAARRRAAPVDRGIAMRLIFPLTLLGLLAACGADGAPEAPAAPGITISGDARAGVVGTM